MLAVIVLILIVLWFLGYVRIGNLNIPDISLFTLNGVDISLWDVLILTVVLWAVSVLPSPLRQIIAVGIVIWVLSTIGVIAIAGLSSLIIIAIILGLLFSLLGG